MYTRALYVSLCIALLCTLYPTHKRVHKGYYDYHAKKDVVIALSLDMDKWTQTVHVHHSSFPGKSRPCAQFICMCTFWKLQVGKYYALMHNQLSIGKMPFNGYFK